MARRRPDRSLYSYVHEGTTIDGSFVAEGRARIDGRVRGAVRVGGVLQVGPTGRLDDGPVRVDELHVAGTVRAPVVAAGAVEVWRGGRLEGEVRCASLAIENGGRFVGRRVGPEEPEGTAAPFDAAAGAVRTEER